MDNLIHIEERQYWKCLSILFGHEVSKLFFKKEMMLKVSNHEDIKLFWAIMYKIAGKPVVILTDYGNYFSLNPTEERDYLNRVAIPNNFRNAYKKYLEILEQTSQFIDYKRYSFIVNNFIDIEFVYFKNNAKDEIDAKLLLYINEYTIEEFNLSKRSEKVICNEMHFSTVSAFSHYLESYINSKYFKNSRVYEDK